MGRHTLARAQITTSIMLDESMCAHRMPGRAYSFRLGIIFVPHALLAHAYASSARSYFEEYSIRGASNAMGPFACQMITPALPCRAGGSPQK